MGRIKVHDPSNLFFVTSLVETAFDAKKICFMPSSTGGSSELKVGLESSFPHFFEIFDLALMCPEWQENGYHRVIMQPGLILPCI